MQIADECSLVSVLLPCVGGLIRCLGDERIHSFLFQGKDTFGRLMRHTFVHCALRSEALALLLCFAASYSVCALVHGNL